MGGFSWRRVGADTGPQSLWFLAAIWQPARLPVPPAGLSSVLCPAAPPSRMSNIPHLGFCGGPWARLPYPAAVPVPGNVTCYVRAFGWSPVDRFFQGGQPCPVAPHALLARLCPLPSIFQWVSGPFPESPPYPPNSRLGLPFPSLILLSCQCPRWVRPGPCLRLREPRVMPFASVLASIKKAPSSSLNPLPEGSFPARSRVQ